MTEISVLFAARTDVGLARASNEDAFEVTDLTSGAHLDGNHTSASLVLGERGALFALSDGMGGHAAGEVASALVLKSVRTALQSAAPGPPQQRLEWAVRQANADVIEAAKAKGRHGMGATLTAVVVEGTQAFVAEVGDSRAYLLRSGKLKQLTRDQSLVQMLVDQGLMSQEEAENSERKNILLQAMGTSPEVHAAIAQVTLRRHDRLLLCSDGISNALSHDELQEILVVNGPEAACNRLIALGNERGGDDNLTALVALFDGTGLESATPSETVTATFAVIKDFGERRLV